MNRSATGLMIAATLAMSASGCRVVGGIFKAGVGVGIVVCVVVVALIAAIAMGVRSMVRGGGPAA